MDSNAMTAEKLSKTGGTVEEVKQRVLESLAKIKEDEKVNYLVNKLVQHEIESQKAKTESQQLQAQTKKAALVRPWMVGDYDNFGISA